MSKFRALIFVILLGILVPFWALAEGGAISPDLSDDDTSLLDTSPLPTAQYPKVMACLQEALPNDVVTFTHRLLVNGLIQDFNIRLDTMGLSHSNVRVPAVFFRCPRYGWARLLKLY